MKTAWQKLAAGFFELNGYMRGRWRRLVTIVGDGNVGRWTVKLHRDPRTGKRWRSVKSIQEWVASIMERQ